MRLFLRIALVVAPLVIIVASAVIPTPLSWTIGGMIFGLLLFQLALAGSFEGMLPNSRVYIALREETDELLELVRELNAAVIDAKRAGLDPGRYTTPIVQQMHETVDRLPGFAGESMDGRLHLTPLAGRNPDAWEHEIH